MTKLIYISHPASKVDFDVSPEKWGLSDKGFKEANELMKKIFWNEVQVIYTSSEPKATQVGDLAKEEYGLGYIIDVRLGEADRSKAQVVPADEYLELVKQAYENPEESINNWESHHSMYERNKDVVDEIISKHKNQTIVIIGHGGAGTCVKCYVSKRKLNFEEDPKQTGCIFIADLDKFELLKDWYKY